MGIYRLRHLCLLALVLASIISLSGCLGPIADQDKFSSDTTVVYNLTKYLNPNLCAPVNGLSPCTCMVCSNQTQGFFKSAWNSIKSLFGASGSLESSLGGSRCEFFDCNLSTYNDSISLKADGTPQTCVIRGDKKQCFPRMFMIGQGPNAAEFSMAQRYCGGRLTMPVLWATPARNPDGSLTPSSTPQPPKGSQIMCYLERDQMPVIVPYANGQPISLNDIGDLAAAYNHPNDDLPVDGPAIVTTQALVDPRLPPADPAHPQIRLLDRNALQNVVNQVNRIHQSCPDCLTAIAIKPLLNPDGTPDLCAMDYLLNNTPTDPAGTPDLPGAPAHTSNGCAAEFGMSQSEYDIVGAGHRGQLGYSTTPSPDPGILYNVKPVDLVGVGFMANDDPNLPSCSLKGELGRYLYYSKSILNAYHVPSVWYAVGFSVGQTATPGCSLTSADVADAYNSILSGIPMYASSGVIGVAPYRFLDSPAGAPVACTLPGPLSFTVATATPDDTGLPGPASLSSVQPGTLLSSANALQSLTVQSITSISPAPPAAPASITFIGDDNLAYLAKMENGQLKLYTISCSYGFRDSAGALRQDSSYAWFSNCKFYYTNNPSFAADPPPSLSEKGTQQPVMFSTNGMGAVCSAFSANKMLTRFGVTGSSNEAVVPPADPAELTRLTSLQCGACLSDAPMPKAFCPYASGATFSKSACTQYIEMDDAFMSKGLDPILLRAIAIGESSLGGTADPAPSGALAPACAMSPGGPCGSGDKSPATLANYPSDYCAASTIQTKANSLNPVCALGVMQCIKAPSSTYNPFDPYQSALCGSDIFLGAYKARLNLLNSVASLKSEIAPAEMDWYAAWLAADSYYGMWLASGTSNFKPGDIDTAQHIRDYPGHYGGGFIQYMEDYYTSELKNHPNWQPDYGLRVIRRYNAGIQTCGSGCAYQSC